MGPRSRCSSALWKRCPDQMNHAALRRTLAQAEADLTELAGGPAPTLSALAFRVERLRRYRRIDIKARLERVRLEIHVRRA